MYVSRMSERARYWLDIFSYVGVFVLIYGVVKYFIGGAQGLNTVILSVLFIMNLIASCFALAGAIVTFIQRMKDFDKALTKKQLITGRGFCAFGGLAAGVISLCAFIIDCIMMYEGVDCFAAQGIMFSGGLICFAFGLPVFVSFRKQ